MAVHGKNSGVLVGKYDPTVYFTDYTVTNSIDTAETTGFMKAAKEYIPGQADGTVSFSGRYQGSKATVEAVFERIQDNSDGDPFLICTEGWVPGSRVRYGIGLRTGFDISGSVGDVVGTSANLQAHQGVRSGIMLGRNTWGAGTFTSVSADTGENSPAEYTNGLAQFHITANTLNQAAVLTLQQSSDGSTWVDTPATLTVAANTIVADRKTTGASGARYQRIRAVIPAGATGSITVTAAFGRN